MINASIKITPHMPNTLEEFAPQVVALADRLGIFVEFHWNGCDVTVHPKANPAEVERLILEAMRLGSKAVVVFP